jgi:hypothetical protein
MSYGKVLILISFVIGLFGWAFLISSCSSKTSVPVDAPDIPQIQDSQRKVEESAHSIGEVSADVGSRAEKIDQHATNIETKTPPAVRETVNPEIQGIREETKGLRQDQATLSATELKLKQVQAELGDQQSKVDEYVSYTKQADADRLKLIDKIKDLESSRSKLMTTLLSFLTVGCVIGVGACVVIGFIFKTPMAFMIAAGLFITMGVSIAITVFIQQIAWIFIIALGLSVAIAIAYVVIQIRKKDNAVKELVHTGEVAKTYLPTTAREKIFGNAVEPGLADQIQSDSTIKIVKQVRKQDEDKRGYGLAPELPKFWKPTPSDLSNVVADPYSASRIIINDPYGSRNVAYVNEYAQESNRNSENASSESLFRKNTSTIIG